MAKTDRLDADHLTHSQMIILATLYSEMNDLDNALKTDERIVQIATDCGFGSHKYFTDRFRQYFSMTPTEFRKARE